jgi:hypothetical protein
MYLYLVDILVSGKITQVLIRPVFVRDSQYKLNRKCFIAPPAHTCKPLANISRQGAITDLEIMYQ